MRGCSARLFSALRVVIALALAAAAPTSGGAPAGDASGTGAQGKAAGSEERPPAAPFGLVLGEATEADLKARIPGVIRSGVDRFTGGPRYSAAGRELPAPGFRQAVFSFDQKGRLAAVILRYRKRGNGERFRELVRILSEKYELKRKVDPPVGDRRAEFVGGKATLVHVDEPHLSFEGTVLYQTFGYLMAGFEAMERAEKQRQKRLRDNL